VLPDQLQGTKIISLQKDIPLPQLCRLTNCKAGKSFHCQYGFLVIFALKKIKMKQLILALGIVLSTLAVKAQPASDYIKVDSNVIHTNYAMYWKTALFNQVVAVFDSKNQPLMLLMLPANGSHSPVPGTYNFVEGKKRAVKKGSQTAKLEYEPGYNSTDDAGTLTITENDGIFWFTAENISIIKNKTGETHKISFKMGMFIEKK
jgi:hypothetical protein